jgi:hypothetical protein
MYISTIGQNLLSIIGLYDLKYSFVSVSYSSPNFTISGNITSDVWLEYSTNAGANYTRLSTAFPSGTQIVTSDLPTNTALKVRLVAVCDETKVSNVYDYTPFGVKIFLSNLLNC